MVTDAIISALTAVVHLILSALPTVTVPGWMSDNGAIGTVFQDAGSMGVWFPVPLAVTVVGAVLAAWAVGWGIKLARIIASYLTAGGGSAG
jgi:hypothetical protein